MHTEPLASFAVAEHAEKPRARLADRSAEGRAALVETSVGMARLHWFRMGAIARWGWICKGMGILLLGDYGCPRKRRRRSRYQEK